MMWKYIPVVNYSLEPYSVNENIPVKYVIRESVYYVEHASFPFTTHRSPSFCLFRDWLGFLLFQYQKKTSFSSTIIYLAKYERRATVVVRLMGLPYL